MNRALKRGIFINEKVSMNAMKTTLLLALLSGLLIIGGGALAGERGLVFGLVLAIAMNFSSYFFSEKMALMSTRAQRGWGSPCRSFG